MPATKKLLYTADEVAEMTSLSRRQVWKLAREKRIAHHRIGRELRFNDAQVADLLATTLVVPAEGDQDLVPAGRAR